MSAYDLPAMIDLALNTTGQKKLFYIGHSEGTTTMFAQTKIQDKVSSTDWILPLFFIFLLYLFAVVFYLSFCTLFLVYYFADFPKILHSQKNNK